MSPFQQRTTQHPLCVCSNSGSIMTKWILECKIRFGLRSYLKLVMSSTTQKLFRTAVTAIESYSQCAACDGKHVGRYKRLHNEDADKKYPWFSTRFLVTRDHRTNNFFCLLYHIWRHLHRITLISCEVFKFFSTKWNRRNSLESDHILAVFVL